MSVEDPIDPIENPGWSGVFTFQPRSGKVRVDHLTGVAGQYIYMLVDNEGCVDSALLEIGFLPPDDPQCGPFGMDEPGWGVIRIFPVPTEETLCIVASGQAHRIEIHDARGRLIGTPPWAGVWPMTISMKDYPGGTYTVTVHLANGLVRGRIVKM